MSEALKKACTRAHDALLQITSTHPGHCLCVPCSTRIDRQRYEKYCQFMTWHQEQGKKT